MRDTSREGFVVSHGSSSTTRLVHGTGNTAIVSATTTYQPSQASSFIRPGGIMVITLVRAPVPRSVRYFDALEVMAAISPRVRRTDDAATPSAVAVDSAPIEPRLFASIQAQPPTEMQRPQATAVSRVAFLAARCDGVETAWNEARQRGDSQAAPLEGDIWRAECSDPSR